MNTRLTGKGLHAAAPRCSQAAISAFSQPASTTRPSTPAVLRPALTSVTRRTLTRAPERDRSISFCRLRTRLRSPACDAVKIRCRSRRTFSSAARQLTASQPQGTSSGPFTTIVASNLPSVPASSSSSASRAHLTASAPFRARAPGPVSGQLSRTASGGPAIAPGFPAAFRPPAFASRSPCSRPGPGPSLRSAYRAPPGCPDPDGVSTFHTCEIRPGWVPPLPRGRRCSPRPDAVPGRRLPLPSGQSLHPAPASHQRGSSITGHQRGFTRFTRPVCPSPVASRMGRETLGLSPVLRTPPLPAAHDRAGPGREHAPGTTLPTSSALQSASSLAWCDLVSQRQMRTFSLPRPCRIIIQADRPRVGPNRRLPDDREIRLSLR
jgi:hypothetical protein